MAPWDRWLEMTQQLTTSRPIHSQLQPAPRLARGLVAGGAALVVLLMLGALVMWAHYGTAVFFEMIASGLSACF